MTKRERIEELERKVAELEARKPAEYHYHFDRPVYYGLQRCQWCGAGWYLGHSCAFGISRYPTWGGVLTTVSGTTTGAVFADANQVAEAAWNGSESFVGGNW